MIELAGCLSLFNSMFLIANLVHFSPSYDSNMHASMCHTGQGYTGLHYAAVAGHSECFSCLLRHGADSTLCSNNGKTPMDLSRKQGKSLAISKASQYLPPSLSLSLSVSVSFSLCLCLCLSPSPSLSLCHCLSPSPSPSSSLSFSFSASFPPLSLPPLPPSLSLSLSLSVPAASQCQCSALVTHVCTCIVFAVYCSLKFVYQILCPSSGHLNWQDFWLNSGVDPYFRSRLPVSPEHS